MAQCRNLLSDRTLSEESVRRGDIYALMIQKCVNESNFTEAKKLLDELQLLLKGDTPVTCYISKDILESLSRQLKIPVESMPQHVAKTESAIEHIQEQNE